jgi:hypothetical protein
MHAEWRARTRDWCNTVEIGSLLFGVMLFGSLSLPNCHPFGELALSSILLRTVAPLRYTPCTMARTEEHNGTQITGNYNNGNKTFLGETEELFKSNNDY